MDETSKTKKVWSQLELGCLQGEGIDIGCGGDPIFPHAVPFDQQHGDANVITKYVTRTFDFVFSSHCLEHMRDPHAALQEWWRLVRPGGHLFILVPDEDLYEQGAFPSRFNPDHKCTFTISKQKSWSPKSVNVLDLVTTLQGGQLIRAVLQDMNYDYSLLRHGPSRYPPRAVGWLFRIDAIIQRAFGRGSRILQELKGYYTVVDQTMMAGRLAQIQFIVRKIS